MDQAWAAREGIYHTVHRCGVQNKSAQKAKLNTRYKHLNIYLVYIYKCMKVILS